ncbi:MAG TPA: cache domain-containing protein [Tabrizicola sp.]
MASRPLVTLSGAFLWFVLLSAVVGAAFTFLVLRWSADRLTENAMSEAVEVRSAALLQSLGRELTDEWLRLEALADKLSTTSPEALRPVMDQMIAEGDKISWVGFASLDGTVQAAAGGLLEGADVSGRPWFREGLKGDFAGDVHEAVLLAKLIGKADGDPLRFLDYAVPVRDSTGRQVGVLGLHINFDWAARLIEGIAASLRIDAVLVSQDGTAIVSTLESNPAQPTAAPFRLASLGTEQSVRAVWADGETYFSYVRPVELGDRTPNFGWRLIARVDNSEFANIDKELPSRLLPFVLGMLAILTFATLLFVRLFAQPFGTAARNAVAIARGEDVFPFESHRTRELAELSEAVARLQARDRQLLSRGSS